MGRVVVVGSTNTDMTVHVPRIPRPGETVLGGAFRITAGGKGANQAVAAARAGGQVVFVTALGNDDFGRRALENLGRDGIDVRHVRQIAGVPSGVALIVVDDRGENSIAVAPGANAELGLEDIAPLAAGLGPADVVLLQLEIPLAVVETAAGVAAARGARVLLNPAPARPLPDSLLRSLSLLTPNEAEAVALGGTDDGGDDAIAAAAAALRARGVRDIVVTLGARGAMVFSAGGVDRLAAFPVTAVDTTAAGDVFNGALAVALVEGRLLRDAVRFASAAAALSVTRHGAQASAPARAEIEALLVEQPERTH